MSSGNGLKPIVMSIGAKALNYSQNMSTSSELVDTLLHQLNVHISQRISRFPHDPYVNAESGLFSQLCSSLGYMKNANHEFLTTVQSLVQQYERADLEYNSLEAMKGGFVDKMKKQHDTEIERVSSRLNELEIKAEEREESLKELKRVNKELNEAYHELKEEDIRRKSKMVELSCLNSRIKEDSEGLKKEISNRISSESSKIFSMRKMEKEMKELKETITLKNAEILSLNESVEKERVDLEVRSTKEQSKTAKMKEERDMLKSKRNDMENAFIAVKETNKYLLKKEPKNQVTYLVSAVIEMKPNSQELGPLKEVFDRMNSNSKELITEMLRNCVEVNMEFFDKSLKKPLERFSRYLQTEKDQFIKNISSEENSDGPYPASASSEEEHYDPLHKVHSAGVSFPKRITKSSEDFHSGGSSVLYGSVKAEDEPMEIPVLFHRSRFELECRKIALIQVSKEYEKRDPNKSRMIKEVVYREVKSELDWFMQGCVGLDVIAFPAFKVDEAGMVSVDFGVLSGSGLSWQEGDMIDSGFKIDRRPQMFFTKFMMTDSFHSFVLVLNNYFTKYPERVDKESVDNFCGKGWLSKDITVMTQDEKFKWSFLSRSKQIC